MDFDLSMLRAFVAVAEELHFGRAAARLGIGQPVVGQQVRALENSLGVQLLDRANRRLQLTAAGRALAGDGRDLLVRAEAVAERVRRLGRGELGALRVAVIDATPGIMTTPLLRTVEQRLPDLTVDLVHVAWAEQVSCLHAGSADVSFVRVAVDDPDLLLEPVLEEPHVAALARSHPLAARPRLSLRELYSEPVVDSPDQRDFWSTRPARFGEPRWGPQAETIDQMLALVAGGGGIGVTAGSVGTVYGRGDVAFVPISDIEPSRVALARLWRTSSPSVDAFLEVLRAVRDGLVIDLT
jgi:LysR family transcriptional regulator, benzoate and cis,cis-muconate-responsive activator of ben and cat genes